MGVCLGNFDMGMGLEVGMDMRYVHVYVIIGEFCSINIYAVFVLAHCKIWQHDEKKY